MRIGNKGVSPLIATILLLLVAMGIGALVWGFMQEYTTEQTSTAQATASELATCSEGGIKITSCTYTASLQRVRIKVENTGKRDLNSFWVNVQYTDGNATQVKTDRNVLAGSFDYIDGNAQSTPSKVKIQSVQCSSIKDSVTSCPAG